MSHDLAVLLVFGIIFGLPVLGGIIAVLARHQQRMAEILQRNAGTNGSMPRIEAELRELRDLVAQQALAMDTLVESHRKLAVRLEEAPVSDRLTV